MLDVMKFIQDIANATGALSDVIGKETAVGKGLAVAQAVLCPVVSGKWVDLIKVEKINDKDRNSNGFGSTGL